VDVVSMPSSMAHTTGSVRNHDVQGALCRVTRLDLMQHPLSAQRETVWGKQTPQICHAVT
jgi:hypothetical protein